MLQPVTMIQHTVRSHSDALISEFLYILTFHHISKEETDVFPDIGFLCDHFLCQSPRTHLVLFLQYFFCIQHGNTIVFLLIHLLIDFHRCLRILRLNNEKQFVTSHITFYRVVPSLITDIQKIRKNLHIYEGTGSFINLILQFDPGRFQLLWIRFSSLFQLL